MKPAFPSFTSGKELEAWNQECRPLHVGGQEEAERGRTMAQVFRAAARHGGGRLLQTEPARRRLLLHELQHVVGRVGSREGGQSATHRNVPPSESFSNYSPRTLEMFPSRTLVQI